MTIILNHIIKVYFLQLLLTPILDKIMHQLIFNSSFIFTSSAITVRPYIRTQSPTWHLQEIIVFLMKQLLPIITFSTKVQSANLQPACTVQPGPITTFGPILHPSSILLLSWINTLPSQMTFGLVSAILQYYKQDPWPIIQSPGFPISNQNLDGRARLDSSCLLARFGNIYFSIMQNLSGIISITDVFNRQIPALILLEMKQLGFSTNLLTVPSSSVTTTPNLLGSSTDARTIVADFLCDLWKSTNCCKGQSQMISLLNTKNNPSLLFSFKIFSASFIGPAVPKAAVSCEYISVILYFYSKSFNSDLMSSA